VSSFILQKTDVCHATANLCRQKASRIAKLTEEANELKAIEAHIAEKLQFLVKEYKQLQTKRQALVKARNEALSIDRQVSAQQLAIEIGVVGADMESLEAETKELQRQAYFVSLERNRKRKLAKTLNAELEAELNRLDLEKQIAADIKKVVSKNAA
jgi:septal ring factor EnvC (AmiA/AmiB activator)